MKLKFLEKWIYELPVVEKKSKRDKKSGKNVPYEKKQNTKKPPKCPNSLKEIKGELELQPPQLQNAMVNKHKIMLGLNKK